MAHRADGQALLHSRHLGTPKKEDSAEETVTVGQSENQVDNLVSRQKNSLPRTGLICLFR